MPRPISLSSSRTSKAVTSSKYKTTTLRPSVRNRRAAISTILLTAATPTPSRKISSPSVRRKNQMTKKIINCSSLKMSPITKEFRKSKCSRTLTKNLKKKSKNGFRRANSKSNQCKRSNSIKPEPAHSTKPINLRNCWQNNLKSLKSLTWWPKKHKFSINLN